MWLDNICLIIDRQPSIIQNHAAADKVSKSKEANDECNLDTITRMTRRKCMPLYDLYMGPIWPYVKLCEKWIS